MVRFFGFCLAVMALLAAAGSALADSPLDAWNDPDSGAPWLTEELLQAVFPGATDAGRLEGEPPAAPVYSGPDLVGYIFVTIDATSSLGFSSLPFVIAVGLGLDGTLTGVTVVDHREPIIDLIMLHDSVPGFARQYAGLDIRSPRRIRLTKAGEPSSLDGISSATISAVLFNEAILRSARLVALGRGIRITDEPTVDIVNYEQRDFAALLADGSIGKMEITLDEVIAAGVSEPDLAENFSAADADAPVLTVHVAPVLPPTIGKTLLSENWYNLFVSGRSSKDMVLLIMNSGRYLIDDSKLVASGPFRRLRVVQGDTTYTLSKDRFRYLGFLHGSDKPRFTEMGLYWLPAETGIEPLLPWRLEIIVENRAGTEQAVFGLDYQIDDEYVLQPTGIAVADDLAEPIWMGAWRTQKVNIAILAVMLATLSAILVFMGPLSRRPRLYPWIRYGFLAFTLGWLGWTVGAQLTIINLLTWMQSAVTNFNIAVFMVDPLIFILLAFVVVTFVIWGRGVFCGWLCPFGALQELLGKVAQALRIPQIQLSYKTHRWLWPVKYVVLAVLVGLSLYATFGGAPEVQAWADTATEVEPFKTAISLYFVRGWPYVIYAATLIAIALTVERFFCRFLCPLGAALAIGGKLRIFNALKRREECGTPCHLCEHKCPIQAIEPTGKINMTECFYCLDCQLVYYDEHACPPLVSAGKARRREQEAEVAGAEIPAVAARSGAPA